jgi:hypothetical protein
MARVVEVEVEMLEVEVAVLRNQIKHHRDNFKDQQELESCVQQVQFEDSHQGQRVL